MTSPITLTPVTELLPQVERVVSRVRAELASWLPQAAFEHIGGTSVPGCVTKGDVDVMACVPPEAFPAAIDVLRVHFAVKQPENWTTQFASFGDDRGYELPLGVQLVTTYPGADFLVFIRDHLLSHPESLVEYNRLKLQSAGRGAKAYWEAKDRFFSALLAART
jgi:GrpB-like predicted nucleotidyltransferase (UPF0157 family)